jgi:hypothetical protein
MTFLRFSKVDPVRWCFFVFLVVDFGQVFLEMDSSNFNSEKSSRKIKSKYVSSRDWILEKIIFHFSKMSLFKVLFYRETSQEKHVLTLTDTALFST